MEPDCSEIVNAFHTQEICVTETVREGLVKDVEDLHGSIDHVCFDPGTLKMILERLCVGIKLDNPETPQQGVVHVCD